MDDPADDPASFLDKLRTAARNRRDAAVGSDPREPVPVSTWEALTAALHDLELGTRAHWVRNGGQAGPVDTAELAGDLPGPDDVVAGADLTWVLVADHGRSRVNDLR